MEYFYNIFGLLILVGILLLKDYRTKDERCKNGYKNNATRNTVLIRMGVVLLLVGGGGVYFKHRAANSPSISNVKELLPRNSIVRSKNRSIKKKIKPSKSKKKIKKTFWKYTNPMDEKGVIGLTSAMGKSTKKFFGSKVKIGTRCDMKRRRNDLILIGKFYKRKIKKQYIEAVLKYDNKKVVKTKLKINSRGKILRFKGIAQLKNFKKYKSLKIGIKTDRWDYFNFELNGASRSIASVEGDCIF